MSKVQMHIDAIPVYKYAMSFHYKLGQHMPLVEFIKSRFEVEYWWKLECSTVGNWHIQACGKTRHMVDDNLRKKFQRGGQYSKYLRRKDEMSDESDDSLKKAYGFGLTKTTWRRNILYVCKPFTLTNGHTVTSNEFQGGTSESTESWAAACEEASEVTQIVESVRKKQKIVSFEQRITEWYASLTEPPQTLQGVLDALWDDKVIPCSQHTPQAYARAATWIMCNFVHSGTKSVWKENFMASVDKYL